MSSSRNMIQDEFLPNCDDKLKEKKHSALLKTFKKCYTS